MILTDKGQIGPDCFPNISDLGQAQQAYSDPCSKLIEILAAKDIKRFQ